jgi:hypothetical protein
MPAMSFDAAKVVKIALGEFLSMNLMVEFCSLKIFSA